MQGEKCIRARHLYNCIALSVATEFVAKRGQRRQHLLTKRLGRRIRDIVHETVFSETTKQVRNVSIMFIQYGL